jgi:hypothetical protein
MDTENDRGAKPPVTDLDYLEIQISGRLRALIPPRVPRDLIADDSTPPPPSWRFELLAGADDDPTLPVPRSFLESRRR